MPEREFWRISNHQLLDGAGGLRAPGRWHTRGQRVVYLAESPAGALIEALVHLEIDPATLPRGYTLMKIAAPAELAIATATIRTLGPKASDLDATQRLGDLWLAGCEGALLRVPSAILPDTFNLLLNPAHPDAAQLRVVTRANYPWHPHLLR